MNSIVTKQTSLLTLVAVVMLLPLQPANAGCSDKREPGVDWSGCKKINKMLGKSNFSGSRFDETIMSSSSLDRNNFSNASLVKADLSRASLTYGQFKQTDLTKVIGYRANFDHSTFKDSQLSKSELSRATFVKSTIENVDWSRSELGRADFSFARLSQVSFEFSNLSRAIFAKASLDDVDFSGAYTYLTHFEDVDLSNVRHLTQAQLDNACGNKKTILPETLSWPQSWPCTE